jgi:electron transfer flavoprotein alpha subunit
MERDNNRQGVIADYVPNFDERDLRVKVLDRKIVKSAVDFDSYKAVVSFGRGIKDSPEQNIKMVTELAKALEAEVGVSLPISKKPFSVSEGTSSIYMIPDRVIGTSGRKIAPLLYVAAGISGAMQHIAGMKESGFVVAINPDENSPIKDECDIFIKGRMEEVIPLLLEELRKQKPAIEVRK